MSDDPKPRGLQIRSDFIVTVVIFAIVVTVLVVLVKNGVLPQHFFTFR